jgi:hypothetical protein
MQWHAMLHKPDRQALSFAAYSCATLLWLFICCPMLASASHLRLPSSRLLTGSGRRPSVTVSLKLQKGTALNIALDHRVPIRRSGESVEGRLVEQSMRLIALWLRQDRWS